MRHLRNLKGLLQRTGGFHKIGDEISMGPESPPGAMVAGEVDPEWVMVTVQSPFFFQWTDIDMPLDAPRLRSIEAHMTATLGPPVVRDPAGRINPPTIRGRAIGSPVELTVKT